MNATTQGNDRIVLEKFSALGKDANVILIVGKTRVGKSTFINDVKGSKVVISTSSMKSDTKDTSAVEVKLSDGRNVYLIDTIGFEGSGEDHSLTDLAARYVSLFHNEDGTEGPKISGFLYFINITDDAGLNGASKDNLNFTDAFIGKELHPSLCFVINKWSKNDEAREDQEQRETEWVTVLKDRFPEARIERLHYKHPRTTESRLAAMNERARGNEQAKYRESALGIVESAMKKPAEKRTLLEKDISENAEVGDTHAFKAAVVSKAKDIKAMKKAGKSAMAKVVCDETNNIGRTKMGHAGDVAKARKRAREAGGKALGKPGEVIGGLYERAGEMVIGAYSLISNAKQKEALGKVYREKMVPRTAEMAENGAKHGAKGFGVPGKIIGTMVGTAAGTALNWYDGFTTYWGIDDSD